MEVALRRWAAGFALAVEAGTEAVLAASVVYFGELSIDQLNDALHRSAHPDFGAYSGGHV